MEHKRLPPKRFSLFRVAGCILVLIGLYFNLYMLQVPGDISTSIYSLLYYITAMILFLSALLFVVFSFLFPERHRVLCFIPLAGYILGIIIFQSDLLSSIVSGYNSLLAYLPDYPVSFIWVLTQIVFMLASFAVTLFCYLDRIPSYIGGILLGTAGLSYALYDLYIYVFYGQPPFRSWHASIILVFCGFALSLFSYRRVPAHTSLGPLHTR